MTRKAKASSSSFKSSKFHFARLLRRTWFGINQGFRHRITHLGITPDQYTILRWLVEGDPRGLTQSQIVQLMSTDPNTLTSILGRMEIAGLILRKPHETDKRANRIRITPLGRQRHLSAQKIALYFQTEILACLSKNKIDDFLESLLIIANHCNKMFAEKAPVKKSRRPLQKI